MTATLTTHRSNHQRRLRAAVKRLVIELGYLEHCLAEGLQDVNVRTAAAGLDTAILLRSGRANDCLNEHLSN